MRNEVSYDERKKISRAMANRGFSVEDALRHFKLTRKDVSLIVLGKDVYRDGDFAEEDNAPKSRYLLLGARFLRSRARGAATQLNPQNGVIQVVTVKASRLKGMDNLAYQTKSGFQRGGFTYEERRRAYSYLEEDLIRQFSPIFQ